MWLVQALALTVGCTDGLKVGEFYADVGGGEDAEVHTDATDATDAETGADMPVDAQAIPDARPVADAPSEAAPGGDALGLAQLSFDPPTVTLDCNQNLTFTVAPTAVGLINHGDAIGDLTVAIEGNDAVVFGLKSRCNRTLLAGMTCTSDLSCGHQCAGAATFLAFLTARSGNASAGAVITGRCP